MNKINEFLKGHSTVILVALMLLLLVKNCNLTSQNNKLTKANIELATKSGEQEEKLIKKITKIVELEGYKTSKRVLYDNNTIVRTAQRPDDIMNQYDKKIDELQKEISSSK